MVNVMHAACLTKSLALLCPISTKADLICCHSWQAGAMAEATEPFQLLSIPVAVCESPPTSEGTLPMVGTGAPNALVCWMQYSYGHDALAWPKLVRLPVPHAWSEAVLLLGDAAMEEAAQRV